MAFSRRATRHASRVSRKSRKSCSVVDAIMETQVRRIRIRYLCRKQKLNQLADTIDADETNTQLRK